MSHDDQAGTLSSEGGFAPAGSKHAGEAGDGNVARKLEARRRAGQLTTPPRYQVIASDLEHEIGSGLYPIGGMLPTEAQLVQRFAVSRFTIREALRQLERVGLVRRRQGAGTIVEATEPSERFVQRLLTLEQLRQYPPSRLEVETCVKVRLTRGEARRLQAEHGETWVRYDGVRRATGSGVSHCSATVWLRPEFATVLSPGAMVEGAVHHRLHREFGVRIETVDIEIQSDHYTARECEALGLPLMTPALRILRRYADARNRTIQVSRDSHRAERFTYRLQYHRDGNPA